MTETLAPNVALAALLDGTVIDHIPAGQGLALVKILKLERERVSIALNLPSASLGNKDIIKVQNRALTPSETDRVALLAPQATIIIVKEGKVITKRRIQIPDQVHDIFVCQNPKCITRQEPMETRFSVLEQANALMLRCNYCEALRDQN